MRGTLGSCRWRVLRKFIPVLTYGHVVNELERQLLALPPRLGGLRFKIFSQDAVEEYQNSTSVSLKSLTLGTIVDEERKKEEKSGQKQTSKKPTNKAWYAAARKVPRGSKTDTSQWKLKAYPNWLASLLMRNYEFGLSKQEFREAIRMRYGWALDWLLAICVSGSRFDVPHALSYKRGGFVTLRHNELRNTTADLLRKVCVDVKIDPMLCQTKVRFLELQFTFIYLLCITGLLRLNAPPNKNRKM